MFLHWKVRPAVVVMAVVLMLISACSSEAVSTPHTTVENTEAAPMPSETGSVIPADLLTEPPPTDPPPSAIPLTEASPTEQSSPESISPATLSPFPPTPVETQTVPNPAAIIVDHNSVALFDQIPEEYLRKAANFRMVFYDASVGKNLSEGLDCLASPNWVESPVFCRRDYTGDGQEWRAFVEADYNANRVPERILFPGGPAYDRNRWTFGSLGGSWESATHDFVTQLVPQNLDQYDIFSYKINYLMVAENSNIMHPEQGFFIDQPDQYDVNDLQALIDAHPDKTFFLWTTSLARSIGTQNSEDFNNRMRQYAVENDLPLLDLADILSHNDAGEPCYDNRDGVQSCSNNGECENFPDDDVNLLAICRDYTTEAEGGHLGSVSSGMIRGAKAFWVLMARIAGWQPES